MLLESQKGDHCSKVTGSFILSTEDDEDDRFMIELCFKRCKLPHTLLFVNDGTQAIAYLKGDPPYHDRAEFPFPHLLLLDIKLGSVSGFDVLTWMQNGGLQKPTVLILSGSDLKADKEKAMKLGAREYHYKTGDLKILRKALQDICERWLKIPH